MKCHFPMSSDKQPDTAANSKNVYTYYYYKLSNSYHKMAIRATSWQHKYSKYIVHLKTIYQLRSDGPIVYAKNTLMTNTYGYKIWWAFTMLGHTRYAALDFERFSVQCQFGKHLVGDRLGRCCCGWRVFGGKLKVVCIDNIGLDIGFDISSELFAINSWQ